MTITAYLRVSKNEQDTKNQKRSILEYAQKHDLKIGNWIEIKISSEKNTKERRIDELLAILKPGDVLICSELSRLGRSAGQIAVLIDTLIKNRIQLITLKEGIRVSGKPDISTKVQINMFSLFAEIEKDLISERTKEGLNAAREKGRLPGRPRGKGKSRLDFHDSEIRELLKLGLAKTRIAKRFNVHISTLENYLKKSSSEKKPGLKKSAG